MPLKTPAPERSAGEFTRRVERLTAKAARAKLDALVVQTAINRLYLTGFKSSVGTLVIAPGHEPLLLVDSRYVEMARQAVGSARARLQGQSKWNLGRLGKRGKWRRVGFEGSISYGQSEALRKSLPDVAEWVESERMILDLRMIKSRTEQAALRRAVRLGDAVFEKVIEEARPGMTEWDVRGRLRAWADRLGAQGESFDCIIAAGSNCSKPHAQPGARVLRLGQPLLIDMGVRTEHYCGDMTRTVFLGRASEKMKEVHKIVLRAQRRGIDAVRAGRTCAEVDAAVRKTINRAGYGKYFSHGLGHGIGLAVHESPFLGATNKQPLRSGMVVTIEPGIYLPGVGGVRIEDMVVVRRDGCEVLTRTPKELRII